MKKLFIIKMLIIASITFSLFFVSVSASSDAELQNSSSETLYKLKILQGYEDGSLRLQDKIKRSEFITIIVRILGYENNTDVSGINITFKDIGKNHWAYNNVKIAMKYNIVDGYPDNTIAPDNFVTYAEALSVLVKALGYKDTLVGSWPDNVIGKSNQLGINKNILLPQNKQLTRGEVSVLVNNSLVVNFYGQ